MAEVKSQGAVDAMDVAEGARETEWEKPSFVGDLFLGNLNLDLIHPFPEQPAADKAEADDFLGRLERFLAETVDADKIDEQGEYDYSLFDGLNQLGAWGMKIPKEYGGLGFSATNYNRAIGLVATWCGSTVAWLSAHQSIGVPQPLKLFGTPEQKKKYLPRLAKGAISAFALTEPGVGSDPAKMETTAVKSPDGKGWIINGEKLWCTNATKAELLVVMTRTAPKIVKGKEKKQITAFIVETNSPGFSIEHRCQFMGLRGNVDLRLEAAMAKLFNTEVAWQIADHLVQIRGGRGYETAQSLRARGEKAYPVERILRDMRINRIFEGTSEIQHLFIAREAVDPHMKRGYKILQPETPTKEKLTAAAKAGAHYAAWYPSRYLGWSRFPKFGEFGKLTGHMGYIERTARHLSRSIFHAMMRYQAKLERKQMVLFRIVDIGTDLFAMSAAISYAAMLEKKGQKNAMDLADVFCREARMRIDANFHNLFTDHDDAAYKLVLKLLKGEYDWFKGDLVEPVVPTAEQVEEAVRKLA